MKQHSMSLNKALLNFTPYLLDPYKLSRSIPKPTFEIESFSKNKIKKNKKIKEEEEIYYTQKICQFYRCVPFFFPKAFLLVLKRLGILMSGNPLQLLQKVAQALQLFFQKLQR